MHAALGPSLWVGAAATGNSHSASHSSVTGEQRHRNVTGLWQKFVCQEHKVWSGSGDLVTSVFCCYKTRWPLWPLSLRLCLFILPIRFRFSFKLCLHFSVFFVIFLSNLSILIASMSTFIWMTPKFSSFLSSFAKFTLLIYTFVRMSCQNSNWTFFRLSYHFYLTQLLPVF